MTPTATTDLPHVTVTTDGGCAPNPGFGAWAAVLRSGSVACKVITGWHPSTTNNRMEMQAAISALSALKRPCRVTLRTDSRQVIYAFERKRDRFGKLIHHDLLTKIYALRKVHRVTCQWVKGHAGDTDNEVCDAACAKLIQTRGAFD